MPRQTKPRAPKDPHAPKRPASSYLIFSNKRRPILKEQHPDKKVTELSKLIAAEWKQLTAEQKKPYEAEANELKTRHKAVMEEYLQSEHYQAHKRKLAAWKKRQEEADEDSEPEPTVPPKMRKQKAPKDPNAPKRPQSAFFLFGRTRRPALMAEQKAEGGKVKVALIAKAIGAEWKGLDEEARKPFVASAQAQKEKYAQELKAYKQTDEYKGFQATLAAWKANQKRQAAEMMKAARAQAKQAEAWKHRSPGRAESSGSESESESGSESGSSSDSGAGSSSSSGSGSEANCSRSPPQEHAQARQRPAPAVGGSSRFDDSDESD